MDRLLEVSEESQDMSIAKELEVQHLGKYVSREEVKGGGVFGSTNSEGNLRMWTSECWGGGPGAYFWYQARTQKPEVAAMDVRKEKGKEHRRWAAWLLGGSKRGESSQAAHRAGSREQAQHWRRITGMAKGKGSGVLLWQEESVAILLMHSLNPLLELCYASMALQVHPE